MGDRWAHHGGWGPFPILKIHCRFMYVDKMEVLVMNLQKSHNIFFLKKGWDVKGRLESKL